MSEDMIKNPRRNTISDFRSQKLKRDIEEENRTFPRECNHFFINLILSTKIRLFYKADIPCRGESSQQSS